MTARFIDRATGQPAGEARGDVLIGADGIHSVELANSMVYSSLLGQTMPLPMKGEDWEKRLNQLIAESKLEKKVMQVEASDVASSFRR